jgi:MFS family permease
LLGQVLAVSFLVAAFPALTAMTSEVVPAHIRGIAFSVTGFLSALVSAGSPLLVGALADRFPITVDGEQVGNLAIAFLCVTPLILVGALVVLNGRRHVARDIANVRGVDPSEVAEVEERAETAASPGTVDKPYPVATAIHVVVLGVAFIVATVGEVVAIRGGKLPLTPWTLEGSIETAVVWAICAYPIAMFFAWRLARFISRPFADRSDRTG